MLVRSLDDGLDKYKHTDYLIHIHPQLCLFDDVKFVSGEAFGDPENRPAPPEGRAHNIHPSFPGSPPPAATASAAVKQGGMFIKARANKNTLRDPALLKDTRAGQPLSAWLKVAIVSRLRKPGTLYDTRRQFVIVRPGESGNGTRRWDVYPRKLGRRMDYDKRPDGTFGPDKNKFYNFPHYRRHKGNLLTYHGLTDAGSLCGKTTKSPPTAGPPGSALSAAELERLQWLDDMYWPATVSTCRCFASWPIHRISTNNSRRGSLRSPTCAESTCSKGRWSDRLSKPHSPDRTTRTHIFCTSSSRARSSPPS
jgi:hypothetical protein